MIKEQDRKPSNSFYYEMIIVVMFLIIVAAAIMSIYSKTNKKIYVSNLTEDAQEYSTSFVDCLKAGMEEREAIGEIFIKKENSSLKNVRQDDNITVYYLKGSDLNIEITIEKQETEVGVLKNIELKYDSKYGELYSFSASAYIRK